MKHFNALGFVALLILAGCAQDTLTGISEEGPDGSAMTASKKGVKMDPFGGFVSGYGWFNLSRTDCPAGSLPLDASGTGEAAHLGSFEVHYEHCSYAQVDPTNPTYVGQATITAANGDELNLTYNGIATSLTTFLEYNTISGGTGRFANATGTFVLDGAFGPHPAGYSFSGPFDGKMSSVGSSK